MKSAELSGGTAKPSPAAKEATTPSPGMPRKPAGTIPLKIPPILLEGDQPAPAPAGGPGQRYALGPTPAAGQPQTEGELPEAYGTRQLLLAARDPHWLYAHWDLTREQQRHYNALSADKHLVVRLFRDTTAGPPAAEVHVHPESRHWFVHVDHAGTKYVAQLGYFQAGGGWVTISTSSPTLTPPDTMSTDTSAEFATIPFDLPLAKLVALVKEAAQENVPLVQALQELRAQAHPELPATETSPPAQWTPAQERALAEVISLDRVCRVWMGSLEITELIRRQLAQEIASMAAAQPGAPSFPAGALVGISSPIGGGQPAGDFWLNVNAELIIYGATEATATVTIGGRPIKLRPDGSFSCRFALPDGQYELPVVAVSADQTDGRAAELGFSRRTEYRGEVGAQPQEPSLKPPGPANV